MNKISTNINNDTLNVKWLCLFSKLLCKSLQVTYQYLETKLVILLLLQMNAPSELSINQMNLKMLCMKREIFPFMFLSYFLKRGQQQTFPLKINENSNALEAVYFLLQISHAAKKKF